MNQKTSMPPSLVQAQEKYRSRRAKLTGSVIPLDVLKFLDHVQEKEPSVTTRTGAVWWSIRKAMEIEAK